MQGFTNYIPIEISPLGFQGIGISGRYSTEACARLLGYWPLYFAHQKTVAEINLLGSQLQNADAARAALSGQVEALQGEMKARLASMESARKSDRLAFFCYGLGVAAMTGTGAALGGKGQWIAGAAIGLGVGLGASILIEISRSGAKVKMIGPALLK